MSRWARLLSTWVAAAAVAAGALLVAAATPAQAAAGDCTANGGVAVVVDYGAIRSDIVVRCANRPSSGWAALTSAGFEVTPAGQGFVCKINFEPAAATCASTPPATAYWSYWYALAGQSSWTYSALGATSRTPPAGSVDAWRFGRTDIGGSYGQPGITPAQARGDQPDPPAPVDPTPTPPPATTEAPPAPAPATPAPVAPAPVTTSAAPRSPGAASGSASGSGSTSGSAAPTGSDAPATTAGETSSTSTTSKTSSAPPSGSSSGTGSASPRIVEVQPLSADASTGGGSAVPTVVGVALVAALGGAGGFVAWRRRQQTE